MTWPWKTMTMLPMMIKMMTFVMEDEVNDQYNFGNSNDQSNHINFDHKVAHYDDK
jgi:hypothetical protein